MRRLKYTVMVYDSGTKFWSLDYKLHREDGPAIEWGSGLQEWYLNGFKLTEEEFNTRTKEMTINDLEDHFMANIEVV